jgi:hypothetical protein
VSKPGVETVTRIILPMRSLARGQLHRRLVFERLEDRRVLAVITVNTLSDVNNAGDGLTTLREAVAAAAFNDTINFSVTGTIGLTSTGSGHININKSLTIQGPGANLLTVKAFDPDANGNNDEDGNRVFYVSNGISSLLNVSISGLTLTNGDPNIGDDDSSVGGGAIHNEENLTLVACELTGNFAPGGGAIASSSGALTITDCTFSDNAAKDGGAILIEGASSTLTLTRSTIADNQVSNSGGGILDRGSALTIVDSTVSGNQADERGGGVYIYQGSLDLSCSTISGNISDFDDDQLGSGGGIYNSGGGLDVINSTISGNTSGEDGGGIFSDTSQTITIKHSTVFGNSVTNHSGNDGGGIRSIDTATLNHTIVAGNTKGAGRDDVSGSFVAEFSLIGDRRSASVNNVGGSLIGTSSAPINALLGPLTNNGGMTDTRAPLPGSPAIDAGDPGAVAGLGAIPAMDQRGIPYARVANGDGTGGARIDMGAVEVVPPAPNLPGDYNLNALVDAADYVLWRKTNGSTVPPYSGADGDGSGTITPNDYTVWRTHFGAGIMLAAGSKSVEAAVGLEEPLVLTSVVLAPNDAEELDSVDLPFASLTTCAGSSRGLRTTVQGQKFAAPDSEAELLLATVRSVLKRADSSWGASSDDSSDDRAQDAAFEMLCEDERLALSFDFNW